MFKKFIFTIFLCFSSFLFSDFSPKEAIISTPVADLTGDPYYKLPKKGLSIEEYYQSQPFSGTWKACRRAHQLLFNERVMVLEEKGPEVKVQISNFYFLNESSSSPIDAYWTLKKNLTYLSDLKLKKSGLKKIPTPVSYKEKSTNRDLSTPIITLKKPFYDPATKEVYSVGTRFVSLDGQNLKGTFGEGFFQVYILDPHTKKIRTTQISKRNCIRNYFKNPQDQIKNFVQVLRLWSYQKEGSIPYLLGGWSWTFLCDNDEYETHKEKEGEYAIDRKKWAHSAKAGLDCMGIIGRAAQICEIPFYIKNSTTLLKKLSKINSKEKVELGDIIWYPGHVMVVSSIKKGCVIEAAGYDRGIGKVKENCIQEVFKGVESFEELKTRILEKKPITVLCSDGSTWGTYKNIKILKLNSIFK